jgi:hypothetical protein
MPRKYQDMTLLISRGRGRKRLELKGKFADLRRIKTCSGYPFRYSIRGSDRDTWTPFSLEHGVLVNWTGYFFTKEPVDIPEPDGWLPIMDYCFA